MPGQHVPRILRHDALPAGGRILCAGGGPSLSSWPDGKYLQEPVQIAEGVSAVSSCGFTLFQSPCADVSGNVVAVDSQAGITLFCRESFQVRSLAARVVVDSLRQQSMRTMGHMDTTCGMTLFSPEV
eukprot:761330-Hanusia_phi.AAC.2